MNFSAVILAGGRSSRMGRDKAFLQIDGKTLLARQIDLAREAGATEVLISGRASVDYTGFNCPVLFDEAPDLGPLYGISSGLNVSAHPLLLVLAVDMPYMPAAYLKWLFSQCSNGTGAIPAFGQMIEPLAAYYPKKSLHLIKELRFACKSPGGQDFGRRCVENGLARFIPFSAVESRFFKSLNLPADVPSYRDW